MPLSAVSLQPKHALLQPFGLGLGIGVIGDALAIEIDDDMSALRKDVQRIPIQLFANFIFLIALDSHSFVKIPPQYSCAAPRPMFT